MKTLVLGGVRSGKSRFAGEAAREAGGGVTLIATGTALDEEMAARIRAHRLHRPAHWLVVEEPLRLGAALRAADRPDGVVIVDCLTLWLTNLLCAEDEAQWQRETAELLGALPLLRGQQVLVSNEVGFGIMPTNALARRFADEAGLLHQRVAALCERVVLMVAGLPLPVKGGGAR